MKFPQNNPTRNSYYLDSLHANNTFSFFTEYGKQNKETIVAFSTRLGDFTLRLYKDTPIHRANFIFLAKTGYFDTTGFHRLVPNFVAQFGDSDRLSTVDFRFRGESLVSFDAKVMEGI